MIEDALRSREAQIEILSRQDLWVQALAKHCPESYAEILRRRDEAAQAEDPNYEQIQADFQAAIKSLTGEIMIRCQIITEPTHRTAFHGLLEYIGLGYAGA
jgi:hypothetical protein